MLVHFITHQKTDGMSIINPTEEYYLLESSRLRFIPLTEKHVPLWALFFENNPTERFLGFEGSIKSAFEKAQFWVEKQMDRQKNGEFGQLAIIEKESGQFIGLGGIITREINKISNYEVTYSLFKEVWGKGFGTETAIFFKDFMFRTTNCTSVISIIHRENEASIHVAEKNGMSISEELTFMDMPVFIFRNTPSSK